MREHELMASLSEFCCAVIGSGSEFMLIPLHEEDARANEMCEEGARRGYRYCGVLGIVRGQAASKCADLDAAETMLAASGEFARLVAEHIKAQANFAEWAMRLWALEDTRTPH